MEGVAFICAMHKRHNPYHQKNIIDTLQRDSNLDTFS
jgi:hypothetical protein